MMDSSLRNHALVYQQNQQQQHRREERNFRQQHQGGTGGGGGIGRGMMMGGSDVNGGSYGGSSPHRQSSFQQHQYTIQQQQQYQQQQHQYGSHLQQPQQYHQYQQQQQQQHYLPQHQESAPSSYTHRPPQHHHQQHQVSGGSSQQHYSQHNQSQHQQHQHHQYQQQQPPHYHHHQQQQLQYGGMMSSGSNIAADLASVGSHYSRGSHASSQNSSTVDEAYRRLGQRLSLRAHGGDARAYNRPRQVARIEWTDRSGFLSYPVQQIQRQEREAAIAHATATAAGTIDGGGTNETQVDIPQSSSSGSLDRTNKVAKKRFSDHGDHHYHNDHIIINPSTVEGETSKSPMSISAPKLKNGNLVRKMTVNANELFRLWQDGRAKESKSSKRSSTKAQRSTPTTSATVQQQTGDLSPHRRAFSQMALGSTSDDGQQPQDSEQQLQESPPSSSTGRPFSNPLPHHNSKSKTHSRRRHGGSHEISFGTGSGGESDVHFLPSDGTGGNHQLLNQSLAAVIESASQNSSQNQMDGGGDSIRSRESRGSSSIATRSSMGTRNSARSFGVIPPRGKCLTQPSEGVSNDNLDNIDGNLLVYENDVINVSRRQVHVLCKDRMNDTENGGADFRIQSLLGQGTFAQVFQCLHVQTGNVVAVKVVKNKPAYTRQAAVEIDVFRALTRPSGKDGTALSSSIDQGGGGGSKWDCMVDMICYFMYKDHLCLVFERLGANLYEVLKKRQFRGLPLVVVRTLMRQAVLGTKELAQRSIVHCDLKPENMLLVTEDDVDSIVSAGEHKRLSSSLKSGASSIEKKNVGQEPPLSTATVNTSGHDSGNSSSTCNTDNTNKSRQATVESVKKLNEKIPSMDGTSMANVMDWNSEQTKTTVGNSTQEHRSHSPANSDGTGHTNFTNGTQGYSLAEQRIKLIDFGSACFEGQTAHTYIQSRFYRSPEVLIGLTYDSAIDLWSLGCVAAELFLGLPILPGVHEHDQVGRICEMIADIPDWMLDQGSKSSKYFVKFVPAASSPAPTPPPGGHGSGSSSQPPRGVPQWRIKTQQEYIASLSQSEIQRKGGLAKLEKQPANRYFKRKLLSDIILHKGHSGTQEDKDLLKPFIHFLYGILDPDPWKRWTAFQAASHPFIAGGTLETSNATLSASSPRDENQANRLFGLYWEPPPDPTIYRRKLLNVQKMREKQQAARRGHGRVRTQSPGTHEGLSSVLGYSSGGKASDDTPTQSGSNPTGGRHPAVHARHGAFQMSSSMQDSGNQQNVRVGEDASFVPGPRPFLSGPQSYSEAGASGLLPGSFTELDFAYALQRPGVVPMGESVASSVDLSSGPLPGYGHSSFHHHYHQHHSHQSQVVGSYGSNPMSQAGNVKRRTAAGAVPMTSRSYGEGDVVSAPLEVSHNQPHLLYGSSRTGTHAPTADIAVAGNVASPVPSVVVGSNPPSGSLSSGVAQGTVTDDGILSPPPVGVGTVPNNSFPVYGNAQAYLQQQHAALQQQQLLLQQQQAALALQQEQLRAYEMNQVLLTTNGSGTGSGPTGVGMNAQGFPPQNFAPYGNMTGPGMMPASSVAPPGAFYYMTGVDGTPILVAANPATAVLGGGGGQLASQIVGMPGIVGQLPGLQAMPSGMTPTSLGMIPSQASGLPPGISGVAPPGMNGVPGMMTVGAPGMIQSASPGMLSPPSGVAGGDPSIMGTLYSNNLGQPPQVQHQQKPAQPLIHPQHPLS